MRGHFQALLAPPCASQVEWTSEWINEFGDVFPFDGRGLTLARGLPSTGVVLGACLSGAFAIDMLLSEQAEKTRVFQGTHWPIEAIAHPGTVPGCLSL